MSVVYLVCAVDWEWNDEGGYSCRGDEPLLAFRDRRRAEAHRVELEWKEREAFGHPNPARFPLDCDGCSEAIYLSYSTSLDEPSLVRRLAERGLPLPEESGRDEGHRHDWLSQDWWQQVLARLPRDDWPWLWGLFDHVCFFELVEVPGDSLP
jgi:hypothetical protein